MLAHQLTRNISSKNIKTDAKNFLGTKSVSRCLKIQELKFMTTSLLDHIKIASPCSADWNEMYGDNRKRFCSECRLNVYNLSEMTQREAENFLFEAEGRVCVRLYRRKDGTVINQDCPVGWQAIKQRVSRVATATFGLIVGFFGGLWSSNQISNVYQNSFQEIAIENQETIATNEDTEVVLGIKQLTNQEYIPDMGRPFIKVPEKKFEKKKSSKSDNSKIDFTVNGGISNMNEIMWIFTERYPKEK